MIFTCMQWIASFIIAIIIICMTAYILFWIGVGIADFCRATLNSFYDGYDYIKERLAK